MQKDWRILLLEEILFLFLASGEQACRITIDSPVIRLGSPLLASCSSNCPQIGRGTVVWKLDNNFLAEDQYRNIQENTSSVYFSSFNKTSGLLQCYVNSKEGFYLMDQIHIRAGYPPSPPSNLSCLLKPSNNFVTCTWLSGEDSSLTTDVTLSGSRSVEQCVIPAKTDFDYNPIKGQNFFNIPRSSYHFSKRLTVWVTVKNEFGSATSGPVCFIPREEVKLDPIVISETKATTTGCIKLQWTYGKASFVKDLKCQLRYRNEFQTEWAKPMKRENANAKHLWYIVNHLLQKDISLCHTTDLNCTFLLPHGINRAFIWAQNTAGASPVKEINFFATKGNPVSRMYASPNNDYSIRVEWEPQVHATAYVLEWCKSAQLPKCEFNWKTEFSGSNTSILQENIEPYQMYTVTLYPVYMENIGTPVQTNVYSKEAAPAFSPELKLDSVNKSQAEVHWEPIPLEKRNGFITNYTIFWIDTHGKEEFSTVNGSVTRFKIKNIVPFTTYQVFLRSSTAGGSVNGTILTVYTTFPDNTFLLLVLSLFLFLVIILVFIICIMKHKRMKNHLWPTVPDPAKSQMGKWTSFMEEMPRVMDNPPDVSQFLTSDICIVEGWQGKKPLTQCQETPLKDTDERNNWRSYVNTDTVQYAQVITGGYREQSPPTSVYGRSDSTQPLLCDMSPSPQNYENMWFHSHHQEDNVFLVEEEKNVMDYPLLHALQIHEKGESVNLFN
ncbi:granulocyte colony-stimulating factor receptor [Pyxicephalus adspersus]|uniref:Fibronectin type-III domain-containing protein n=1 Tax=Pyxicephalus adspersus TaxID=30357 RepID=A0AAV3BAT9_PYXAD|nr:TPA: hypothetical protein GDO54_001301 [Pyxicephalus adspersus]